VADDVPTPRPQEPEVFRLLYRSHSRIPGPDRRVVLGELFTHARHRNKERGLSGALLVLDDWFAQALEGEETAVRALFERIAQDPRHEQVRLLDARTVPHRVFAKWAMARVSVDGSPDIPLIAHTDGIAPAAGSRIPPEQAYLLEDMREALRSRAGSA
jgi:hypothetical protein